MQLLQLKIKMLYNWFENIVFANVWMLPFLLLIPVVAWLRYRTSNALKSSLTVSTVDTFKVKTGKNFLNGLLFWLRMLTIAALILALARPQIQNSQSKTKGQGIDIVLCIDVSGSMLAPDFGRRRIDVAKDVAADFIRRRPVDQIALVIFSGESYSLSPLTTNHDALLEQVKSLRSGMLQDGTLIGEGLATSVERLSQSSSASKVVILLTDGKEEPPPTRIIDPHTALEIAKAKSVKVYTVGMAAAPGSAAARAIGMRDATTALDEAMLTRIARETGGAYFRATDEEGLREIYARIDRMEKSSFERITKAKVDEQYGYLLIAALFFLFLEITLRYTLLRTFP